MAEHLLSNVYQVGGGNITHPLDGASYVLVDAVKQEHVLIDCGGLLGREALTRSLSELQIEIGSIAIVYATHGHFDHVAAKSCMPNARLYIHQKDMGGVVTADHDRTATFLYRGQTFPEISDIETIEDGYEIAIGTTALRALHTPGHSPGSVSYELKTDEGTIIVAGDTLWGGYHTKMGSDLDEWQNSLDSLAACRCDYVTFGHGVSRLVPDAMKHIDSARSRFRGELRPSHGGLLLNPWSEHGDVLGVRVSREQAAI